MLKILDWLELHPGTTWQERWNSCGAGADGTADWRDQAVAEPKAAGRLGPRGSQVRNVLGTGMAQLIGGDVLRPALPWLLAATSPTRVAQETGRTRDPAGIAALRGLLDAGTAGNATFSSAVERVALIMAAKGGLVAGITPGDCIELPDRCRRLLLRDTEDADVGGVHDADEEPGNSGGAVGEVPGAVGVVPGRRGVLGGDAGLRAGGSRGWRCRLSPPGAWTAAGRRSAR
jgi:hypothetical protein